MVPRDTVIVVWTPVQQAPVRTLDPAILSETSSRWLTGYDITETSFRAHRAGSADLVLPGSVACPLTACTHAAAVAFLIVASGR